MNIITTIQAALTALNNTADLFMLEKSRAENEELNNTTDTIIVYPDWRTTNQFTQSLELSKTRVYNIDFKTPDEWDNSDNNAPSAYESKTSADRIEDMEVLADSVISYISAHNDLFPEIREKLKWTSPRPILRANNSTMSGVNVQLTIVFSGDRICDYDPTLFTVSYRNAVISDAALGGFATLNFEAKIDTDTDIKFTVNWGVNIGTTIVNDSFITDVWKSLKTKIFIPNDADLNQTLIITDNFGGSFRMNYTIAIPILQCDISGVAHTPQKDAYGLVFDGVVNKSEGGSFQTSIINQDTNPNNAGTYELRLNTIEIVSLVNVGVSTLFATPSGYINGLTDYRFLIWRNETLDQFVVGAIGTFVVYLQGKNKAITITEYLIPNLDEMELVDVSGGSGTNPVTDNTYTTSNYLVADLDSGDQISKINVNGKHLSPYDFTVSTGAYSIIIP